MSSGDILLHLPDHGDYYSDITIVAGSFLKIKYLFKKPDLNSTYPGSYDDIDPAKTTSVSSGKSTSKSLIFNG